MGTRIEIRGDDIGKMLRKDFVTAVNKGAFSTLRRLKRGADTDVVKSITEQYNITGKNLRGKDPGSSGRKFKIWENAFQVNDVNDFQMRIRGRIRNINWASFKARPYGNAVQGGRAPGGLQVKIKKTGGKTKMPGAFLKKMPKGKKPIAMVRQDVVKGKQKKPTFRKKPSGQKLPLFSVGTLSMARILEKRAPDVMNRIETRLDKEFAQNIERAVKRIRK